MSMKSSTMMPPRSRSRICRTISFTASRLVLTIVSSGRLEDTIVKTNLEAVKEIVRQIRLRDLGGIIVLDFIDMEEKKNRLKVFQAIEQELRKDRSPSKALQVSDFGLIIITRKRVKQSLERVMT